MSSKQLQLLSKYHSKSRRALGKGSRKVINTKVSHADRMHRFILDAWGIDALKRGFQKDHYLWFLDEFCSQYSPSYRYRYFLIIRTLLEFRGVWWQCHDDFENREWCWPE